MTLNQIEDEIRQLGEIFNSREVAQKNISMMNSKRLEMIRIASQHKGPVQVVHQLWNSPLIVLTDDSMVSSVLSYCGIETPIHIDGLISATISSELLYATAIDAIIIDESSSLSAVNPNQAPVVTANTLRLHRATPGMLDAALELCRKL